jgi:hypothetical protein
LELRAVARPSASFAAVEILLAVLIMAQEHPREWIAADPEFWKSNPMARVE